MHFTTTRERLRTTCPTSRLRQPRTSWFIKEVERGLRDRFLNILTPCASRPSTRKTSSFSMGFLVTS